MDPIFWILSIRTGTSIKETLIFKRNPNVLKAVDVTKYFIEVSTNELNKYTKMKDQVLEDFEQSDFDYIVSGWKEKIARAKSGDQAWGMFVAKKLYS